jgi:HEAT repeat protein
LVKAAKDPSSFVREAVALSLGKVGGAQAHAALDELSRDEVPQVRDAATASLGNRPKR